MARSISDEDIKLLWGFSAGRCNFPNCKIELLIEASDRDSEAVLGHMAHICAHSSIGPRGDPLFPNSERNRYPNLILLCGHHHAVVDKQPYTYTIKDLKDWKRSHEEWVKLNLAIKMPSINSAELEMVVSAMVSGDNFHDTDYRVITPREKMNKNDLSDKVEHLITMGLSKSREVSHFIEEYSTINQLFPDKLKSSFVTEYNRLRDEEKLHGDALFLELANFSANGRTDLSWTCAGLAVLMYLFERCEVFEK